MNAVGRTLTLTVLVAVVGCGGSSENETERALRDELQSEIEASGREVLNMHCPEERPTLCVARLTTTKGDHFAAVKYSGSGADATVVNHIDQGDVREGPLEDGLKRDLGATYDTKIAKVECNRERFECHAWDEDGTGHVVLVAFDDSEDFSIVTTVGG
jgi:hypothetical protein